MHSKEIRKIKEITFDLWVTIFDFLDQQEHLDGDTAGSMAQAATDVVEKMLVDFYEGQHKRDIPIRRHEDL